MSDHAITAFVFGCFGLVMGAMIGATLVEAQHGALCDQLRTAHASVLPGFCIKAPAKYDAVPQ